MVILLISGKKNCSRSRNCSWHTRTPGISQAGRRLHMKQGLRSFNCLIRAVYIASMNWCFHCRTKESRDHVRHTSHRNQIATSVSSFSSFSFQSGLLGSSSETWGCVVMTHSALLLTDFTGRERGYEWKWVKSGFSQPCFWGSAQRMFWCEHKNNPGSTKLRKPSGWVWEGAQGLSSS